MISRLLLASLSIALAGCVAADASRAKSAAAPSRLAYDFNAANPWTATSVTATGRVKAAFDWAPVGSYDTRDSDAQSPALRLTADATGAASTWRAGLRSGSLPVALGRTPLGKLTLAFDLSASSARPVSVTVMSVDARGRVTGALQGVVQPAAPDFIHRHTLDLDTLKPVGNGKFSLNASSIELVFSIAGDTWPAAKNELRVDNVALATPALYVAPSGSDSADGRTEATALATPQRALDLAQPGDIIALRAGTYHGGERPTASFVRAGTPAAWIVLKNYPGEKPVLKGNGWNIVNIARGSKEEKSTAPALAYLEVRGLHVRGDADTVEKTHPELLDKSEARINTNGIAVDGRYETNPPHHLRFADNLIEWAPGQGVGYLEADWVTIERNVSRNNCRTTVYATSGISTLGAANFDSTKGIYKVLIRDNVSHGNQTRYKWISQKKYSDGNGIILDLNISPTTRPGVNLLGRTLVQGNLVYDNGGSGIHCVGSAHIDIIHNTAYHNSASPHLEYGQIYASWRSTDVRILNNILVARVAKLSEGEKPEPVNPAHGQPTHITYSHNLYFGGNIAPTLGESDCVADPRFVNASVDPAVADFRLRPDSPAIGAGASLPIVPHLDLEGQVRANPPSLGAYEKRK